MSARLEAFTGKDPLSLAPLARELQHDWLVWDAYTEGKRRVDVHPLVLSRASHEAAIAVAERAGELVFRAGDAAAGDPRERGLYKLHPDVERLAAASRGAGDLGTLSRVDLLLKEDGSWIACEVNADCPGGHNEALGLPRLARAAGLRGYENPTDVTLRLVDRLVTISGGPGSPRGVIGLVFATAYAEDLQICAFIERLVTARGGRAMRVPCTGPKEDASGVLRYRGEKLSVLYRYFPIEYMEGQRNIEALARAVERGELATMSSFAAIHAQSKLAMARTFAIDPARARATFPETRALLDLHAAQLFAQQRHWVVKRALSRVGDHVLVGSLMKEDEFRDALGEVAEAEADGDVWIAQRFVPQRTIATPWGDRFLTLGAYLFEGTFAGYFARLSPTSLCGGTALVVPVFVEVDA